MTFHYSFLPLDLIKNQFRLTHVYTYMYIIHTHTNILSSFSNCFQYLFLLFFRKYNLRKNWFGGSAEVLGLLNFETFLHDFIFCLLFCSFLANIDKHVFLKYEMLPRLMNFVCCYVPAVLCLIAFGFSSSKRLFLPFTSPCSLPTESSDSIVHLHVQSNVVIFSFAHAFFHILPPF